MLDYHRELLLDERRTLAYRNAIRATVKPGDVVVDIGSGSGVLALLAAEAGARHVYAIEQQHVADAAAMLVRHLRFDDRVTVLHAHSTKVELPERADVLVTETLGAFGLEEGILGFVVDARARLLKSGASVIPAQVTLTTAPVSLPKQHATHVGWWSERDRYGFDLSQLAVFASNVIYTATIQRDDRLATPADVLRVDLRTADSTRAEGRARFTIERDGVVHGFAGWFSATLAEGIVLSNAKPGHQHWSQTFLPLEHPVSVMRGTEVELDLETHDGQGWRWRGRIGTKAFDQTTWLAPPCIAPG